MWVSLSVSIQSYKLSIFLENIGLVYLWFEDTFYNQTYLDSGAQNVVRIMCIGRRCLFINFGTLWKWKTEFALTACELQLEIIMRNDAIFRSLSFSINFLEGIFHTSNFRKKWINFFLLECNLCSPCHAAAYYTT